MMGRKRPSARTPTGGCGSRSEPRLVETVYCCPLETPFCKDSDMCRLLAFPLLLALLLSSGCAMCCAPYDYDYPFAGGRWVRHNPTSGRVGSAFDEAGGPVDVVPTGTVVEQLPAASAQPQPQSLPPGTRSVIPRNLGESYLPTP